MIKLLKIAIFTSILSLVGCSSFDVHPNLKDHPFETQQVLLTVEQNEDKMPDINTQGFATWTDDSSGLRRCHIVLRYWPQYLGHEVAHCFQGDYHKGDKLGEQHGKGYGYNTDAQ